MYVGHISRAYREMTWVVRVWRLQNWRKFLVRTSLLINWSTNKNEICRAMQLTFSAANPAHSVQRRVAKLRPIAGIKRDERRETARGRNERDEEREKGEALCFLALTVPQSRTTGRVTWRSVRALCTYPGPPFLSLARPARLIVIEDRHDSTCEDTCTK